MVSSLQKMTTQEVMENIYLGEKAKQEEEDFGSIELVYKKKNVTDFVINWFIANRVRTPESIREFFEELDDYVDIIRRDAKRKQKFEQKYKQNLGRGGKYNDFLNDRRRVFNNIIKNQEEKMGDNWIPSELDVIIASDIIYARTTLINQSEKVRQILRSIQVGSRRHNLSTRTRITKYIRTIIYSTVLVNFRIIEFLTRMIRSMDMGNTLEMLEWDLNTLEFSIYNLEQYVLSLLKKKWKEDWTKEFTDQTRELIKLFS